jgi:tetratricopeptide (TPR) repeat protein
LQLLDRRIGREHLLSHINEAIEHAQSGCSANEVEAALWKGFEHALDDRKLLILIDGLDQLNSPRIGNPPALEILDRITRSKKNVKAVVLSRPVSDAALKHCQEHISLERAHSEGSPDIKHFIQDFIYHRAELRHLTEAERHDIVEKYAEAAHHSYVHTELLLRQIDTEDSAADILKSLKPSKTTEELLDRQIGRLDSKRPETKHILTWLVAARRPLSLGEIKALLEVDLDGCAYRPFSGDVEKTVRQLCTPLVTIRDGLVSIRHFSVRERLLSHKASKLAIDIKDAHRELAVRSMAYVKIHLQQKDISPSSTLCEVASIHSGFLQHGFFEYAARYWTYHFKSSCMYDKSTGSITPTAQFKAAFSSSVRLALFEGSCLARESIACDAEKLQHLAYNVRKSLLGEHSAAVLQTLMLELYIARGFRSTTILCEYSFEAWKLSQGICFAVTIQSLAELFVSFSKTLTVSEHPQLCAHKVEVLEYLAEIHSHSRVELRQVEYMTILAELHVEFGHIQKAVVVYRQLYRLRLHTFGHLHEQTYTLFQLLISYLKQLSLHDEVLEVYLEYHTHVETLLITDERRISSTLALIAIYEERKEIFKAEEVLVRFWKSVSTSKSTTRITELKVDFALKYSKFLFRHLRKEESEVILRGVWTEIQSYSYESRFESTMLKKVQKIAKYFSRLEVFSMSRSIYQSLYEHYESHEQRTSTECITIVRSLAETITKSISYSKSVTRSETSTTTSSTTIVSSEEKTLTEIFESCMKSMEITSTTISVCQALCSSYMYEERYEEACEIYSRVICKVWASLETTVSVEVSEFVEFLNEEVFELAFSLAHCHFKMLRIDTAETIYFNLFHALICIRHIDNKHFLLDKIKLVLEFLKITYKYERVIEIYRELFVYMPIAWGKTHRETILVLIDFARVCFKMALYEEAATACFYIYSCFHIAHGCLHFDGFEAAFLLCQIYEIQCKWELAYEVYGYLWRTFIRFGAEYSLDVKIVQKIFTRYVFILEHHHHVEYSVFLQIAREYHEKCVTFYGHHHEITIQATLHYAHVCETREEHRETSISLYEQVIEHCKKTHTEFSKRTLHVCSTRVAKMYASETKHITKAVSIYKEQYESYSKTERTSKETITALHNLIATYKKQDTKESISTATSTLKSSTLEIFQHESRSEKLIESARSIASIYKECNFSKHAETLITEMRSKIVEEIRSSITSSTMVKSNSYVFLASFQDSISESSSFTSVMSELRSEVLLYTSYFQATKKQTDYRSIIQSGCSLYFHLLERKSTHYAEFVKIEKELTECFRKYLNFSRAVQETTMHYFFQLYLKQIDKAHYEHEIVRQATETVLKFTKTAKFTEAYDLVLLIDRFVHVNGGFKSEFYIRAGFNVSKYLVGIGTNKCGDEKLCASMVELSRTILQEALAGLDDVDIELHELQHLLTDLISTLSQQKRYQDLERILQLLWKTKTIRNNLSSSPLVLHIGRSLVQTLAALGKYSDAIHLCKL